MGKNKIDRRKKDNSKQDSMKKKRVIILISFLFILTMAFLLFNQYRTGSLLGTGEKELTPEEQAKEFDDYAGSRIEVIAVEMAKPVSPYKFMLNSIEEAETTLWRALNLDTTLTTAWEKLGYINAQFHGKQALLRYDSYKEKGNEEKVVEEEQNAILYFAKADVYYDKALEYGHPLPDRIYFRKSEAASSQYIFENAAINLLKAIEINPDERMYQAKLIDAYLHAGKFNNALSQIGLYKSTYPESELPYRKLGSYYLFKGDTSAAIRYYMQAAEKGSSPEVGKLLHWYFNNIGDQENAEYYLQKYHEAEAQYDPNKY